MDNFIGTTYFMSFCPLNAYKKYRRQGKMFLRQLSQMLEFTIRISNCCSRSPHEAPSTLLLLTVYARKFLTYEAQSWFSLPWSRLRSSWYLTTHSDQTECSRRTQSSSLFTFVENVWHVSLQSLCIYNLLILQFFYSHTIIQLHATLKTHQSKKLQLIYFASAVVNNAKLLWTHWK